MGKENIYRETMQDRENFALATIRAMSDLQQSFVDPDSGEKRSILLPTGIYAKEPVVVRGSSEFDLAARFLTVNIQVKSSEEQQALIEEVLGILVSPLSQERADSRYNLSLFQIQRYIAAAQFIAGKRMEERRSQ